MSLFDRIKNIYSPATKEEKFLQKDVEFIKREDNHIYDGYEYYHLTDFGYNLMDFKASVDRFLMPEMHSRIELMRIYKHVMRYDSQVGACVLQRRQLAKQGNLMVTLPNGKTIVMDDAYLYSFIDICIDSIFYGKEVGVLDTTGKNIMVHKINEENVDPIDKVILRSTMYEYANEVDSIPYDKGKLGIVSFEVGPNDDNRDLGLLSNCIQYCLDKPLPVWVSHANRFSTLTRVLKTSSENAAKLKAGYKMFSNQMKNNFIILGEEDDLKFEGDTRSNITIYRDLTDYCDQSISKAILGTSSTTDEKSYVGSAEIHKSILDMIIESDRIFINRMLNDVLLPKLILFGIMEEGTRFQLVSNNSSEIDKLIENAGKLKQAGYTVDPSYIAKVTGLPIVGSVSEEGVVEK